MGIITGACHRAESEEEIIVRILTSLTLSEIETKSAYSEFLKCMNMKDKFLDYFMFQSYLSHILGESRFKASQSLFFDNLRKIDDKQLNVKLIGAIVIYLSKGSDEEKIKTLVSHYNRFYRNLNEETVKSFVTDMIEVNTDNCLKAFRDNLGPESVKNLTEVWNKDRKKKLCSHILLNYESVVKKNVPRKRNESSMSYGSEVTRNSTNVMINSPSSLKSQKLNRSFDLEEIIICKKSLFFSSSKTCNKDSDSDVPVKIGTMPDIDNDHDLTKKFLELSFTQLNGDYVRSWLYDNFLKEKSEETVCN